MDTLTKGQRRRHRRVPDDKRQRAAQACAQCKARKSRCVFVGSVGCQRCSRNALACEYLESPNPRTPASEARGPAAPSSIATAVPRRATGEAAPSAIATDAYQAERFMWPGFLAKLRESFSLDPIPDTQESVLQQAPMQAPVEPEVRAAEIRRLEQSAHAFPPRGVAHHLIKVLIQHGTDSFFYFDQARMIRGLEEFYSDRKSSLRYDTGFVCLALASLALGSQWTSLQCNDPSSMLPEYDVDEIGRTCYRHARLLVPDLDDSFSLEAVQAPFVLGVYLLPARATGSLHMYLGLALRKAMAMDLHTKAEAASLDDQEREIRSRLWWSVFSLERTMTVKLNRPRSVDPRIVTVSLPQSLPLLDKVQLFDNSLHQIANAQLTLILDRLSDSSSWSDNSVAAIEARASLKAWKQNLPSALKLENTSLASSDYRTVFHLHLNYHFAWITMGKFKVVSNVRSRLRESSGHVLAGFESTSTQLSKSCIKAAKKMLDLFGCIDQSGHMTKSSFTDFQGCSIATMILLVAGILERDLCYETRISFGLDCLRRMAGDHAAAISGVHFMEALKAIANEAAEKLQRSQALTHSEFLHMSPLSATPQQPDAQLLHLPPVEANTSAFWDRNRPLTEDSIFSASHNTWLEQNGSAWSPNYHSSGDPFALLQFDNEAFLTQLTELEVLGISGS